MNLNEQKQDDEINIGHQYLEPHTQTDAYSSIDLISLQSILSDTLSVENVSRTNMRKFLKKQRRRYTHFEGIKNIQFKNKHQDKNINKKLESYRDENKSNISSTRRIIKKLYSDSILTPQTSLIKKVFAKENTFDENKTCSSNLIHSLDNVSIQSQTTLKQKYSDSSQNDFHSVIEINSAVKLENKNTEKWPKVCPSIKYPEQIKTCDRRKEEVENNVCAGTLNIVLAQVNNVAILDFNKKTNTMKSRENIVFRDSLTSGESYLSESDTITLSSSFEISQSNSKKVNFPNINLKQNSSATLTAQGLDEVNSLNDNFVIAKTSSYFKVNNSDRTLIIRDSTNNLSKLTRNDLQNFNNQNLKPALLDTIINMKMYSDVPKNNLIQDNLDNLNDLIIANENFKIPTLYKFENDLKNATREKFSKSTFRKPFSTEDDGDRLNRIGLPSENIIREMLTGTEKSQKISCSEDSKNDTPVEDLWEKLTAFFDIAIHRLEESLLERIGNELKQALSMFEKFNTPIADSNRTKSGISIKIVKLNTFNEGLQCCLVHNDIIDELALNLKNKCEPARTKSYENNVPEVNKKTEHKLDIIKPPMPNLSKDTALGYSVVASSSEGLKIRDSSKNQCVLRLISRSVRFIKENMIVIVSVPLFCFVLFLVYSFLVLVKTFW